MPTLTSNIPPTGARLFATIALVLMAVTHSDPSFGQSQTEMTEKAGNDWLKAEQQMNVVYSSLAAKIPVESKGRLEEAQETWLRFRKQECAFETDDSIGGSIHRMLVYQCESRLTLQRTKELGKQLNCKEGDLLCTGH
jgi:uncharacterized protein YecT (DUF1311 family)